MYLMRDIFKIISTRPLVNAALKHDRVGRTPAAPKGAIFGGQATQRSGTVKANGVPLFAARFRRHEFAHHQNVKCMRPVQIPFDSLAREIHATHRLRPAIKI